MPQVQNVGEFGDTVSLVGEVKLEEGSNITITRDDAHNSLIISGPPQPGSTATVAINSGPQIRLTFAVPTWEFT